MDWSDVDLQRKRDNAILGARIQDARNDVLEWSDIARSNEALFYLDEMYECLGVLGGIVEARLTGLEPNGKEQEWETRVKGLLNAYEMIKTETSALGMALRNLRNLLDPHRTDSLQALFSQMVKTVAEETGPLAATVKTVVIAALKPLEDEVKDLAKEVRGQEAAAEALQQTTEKGDSYEEQVVEELGTWARPLGMQIHHVGKDNMPGDVLIAPDANSTTGSALTIVLEARDRQAPVGRKAISDILTKAMAHRKANAAIYVSKNPDGLGKEIGDWAEGATGQGSFVACTHLNLLSALRFLVVQERIAQLRAALPEIDSAQLQTQIQRIRTSLDRIKTINRKVSDLRGGAQDIQTESEHLRDEVRDALASIEEALRKTKQPTSQSSPVAGSTLAA